MAKCGANLIQFIRRSFQELCPFVDYLSLHSTILSELTIFSAGALPAGRTLESIQLYANALSADLEDALAAEQNRAAALDEKTFKHAASIATALTLATAATTAVAQLLSEAAWKLAAMAFALPAIVYIIAGGLLGFAAARTLPMFGTGMSFKAELGNADAVMRPFVLARALACQERINQLRVARNETAFMSIRNGFLCLAVAVSVVLLGVQFSQKGDTLERKIWPALLCAAGPNSRVATAFTLAPRQIGNTPSTH